MQIFVAVLLRYFVAIFHYVAFQVVADDFNFYFFDVGKVMIQKKRKIGFAASEIQNSQFRQRTVGKNVVDNFYKTVYLLELVVFGLHHLKILGKNAQVYKSGNIFPFLKDVVFLPVKGKLLLCIGCFIDKSFAFSVFGKQIGYCAIGAKQNYLTVQSNDIFCNHPSASAVAKFSWKAFVSVSFSA